MNAITGEVEVQLAGATYTLRFDWNCLAAIEAAHGDGPNFLSQDTVASIAAIGFHRCHPELTVERLKEISPPFMPFAQTIQQALQYAYFGDAELPDDPEDAKKKSGLNRVGFWRRIKRLWGKG